MITQSFREDGSAHASENIGKTNAIDMILQGEGDCEGSGFRPSNGKTCYGTIALAGDKLKLSGCAAGRLICSKQNRARVDQSGSRSI